MKNIYIKISGFFIASILLFTSCEPNLDINRDPDLLAPEQVPMQSELPAAITGIGASQGSYYALAGGFWSQYWTQSAIANQYKQIDDYTLPAASGHVNGAWSSMYDALTDVRNIKAIAESEANWNYYLVATCLEVYANQMLVDFYGTIPYSEANNPEILNPVFDSGEQVYDQMVADLADALSKDLSESPVENSPGASDFIFEGDMDQWTRFAYTMMLKLHMRQTEARPEVAAAIGGLLTAQVPFLESDAAITQFADEASKSNPLFETDRRQLNVGTNLRASATLGTFLGNASDPRLPLYYDGTTFQVQGNFDQGSSNASVVILTPVDPVYFISAAESYFLQAEANVRYGDAGDAQTLYEMGVQAAFAQWGLDATDLLAGLYAYPNGSADDNIKAIITQKWAAGFPGNGLESFFEQNRTGYPEISDVPQTDPAYTPGEFSYSVEGKTGGLFPKRFVYPQDERQRNSNAPAASSITDPVWYDVN